MNEIAQEVQNGLDTFVPDQTIPQANIVSNGYVKTWFIPCTDTLRHWRANQYNLGLSILPMIMEPRDPQPDVRLQIGTYRSIYPISPISTANNFAELVRGTYYDSGWAFGVDVRTIDFDDVLVLGGSYYIVVRVEVQDVAGINGAMVTFTGWTIADTNIPGAIVEDNTSTGNLPTTYPGTNLVTVTSTYPYVRSDYV